MKVREREGKVKKKNDQGSRGKKGGNANKGKC